ELFELPVQPRRVEGPDVPGVAAGGEQAAAVPYAPDVAARRRTRRSAIAISRDREWFQHRGDHFRVGELHLCPNQLHLVREHPGVAAEHRQGRDVANVALAKETDEVVVDLR